MKRTNVRTLDLFCGCGGLTVGFERHHGRIAFETVLGVDIDAAALGVFNRNLDSPRPGRRVPTGRRCDLSWFGHRSEVLLYYLVHYALWRPDRRLSSALDDLGVREMLGRLRATDDAFARDAARLGASAAWRDAWSRIDPATTTLALYRGVVARLGVAGLRVPVPASGALPWAEETVLLDVPPGRTARAPHRAIERGAARLWDQERARIEQSAARRGKGQHRGVASRMSAVDALLGSKPGLELGARWVRWRAARDSVRARFCIDAEARLEALYRDGRRIDLVLGGPPCKGWSRIGRAVIESLREQGVHAWANHDVGDERNLLLYQYVMFLDALEPSAFLFENVAHFESSLRTPAGSVNAAELLQDAVGAIGGRRFSVSARVVRAREHAVPQDRDRYIMVGLAGQETAAGFFEGLPLDGEVPLSVALAGLAAPGVFDPAARSSPGTEHRVAAQTLLDPATPPAERRYVEWIRAPRRAGDAAPVEVDGHIVRRPRDDDESLYRYLAPGMRWMDYKLGGAPTLARIRRALEDARRRRGDNTELDELVALLDDSLLLRLLLESIDPRHHLLLDGYLAKGTDRHGDWLERLAPDRPCKTIVAHIGKDTYGYVHPSQPRALSLREAARVQSFPDWFRLGGAGVVDSYSMVGNAVPPLLANAFARRFEEMAVFATPDARAPTLRLVATE